MLGVSCCIIRAIVNDGAICIYHTAILPQVVVSSLPFGQAGGDVDASSIVVSIGAHRDVLLICDVYTTTSCSLPVASDIPLVILVVSILSSVSLSLSTPGTDSFSFIVRSTTTPCNALPDRRRVEA